MVGRRRLLLDWRGKFLLWAVFLVAIAGGLVGGAILFVVFKKLLGVNSLNAAKITRNVGVWQIALGTGRRIGEMSFSRRSRRSERPQRRRREPSKRDLEVFVTLRKGVA